MPEPPDINLITRYVLENPWPAAIGLLVVVAILGTIGLREGRKTHLKIAAVAFLFSIGILTTGMLITTSGEHSDLVVRDLVDKVIAGDLTGSAALLSDDAGISIAAPTNPAFGKDAIINGIDRLRVGFRITDHRITDLNAYSVADDRATVHLSCATAVNDWPASPSRWVLDVRRGDDGQWKVHHVTCISINRQKPRLKDMW